MLIAPLYLLAGPLATVAPEAVRPLSTSEMSGLRIWRDGARGIVRSEIAGNVRERWMFAFRNDTRFEIGAISVREVLLSGKDRIYESPPVRISKFMNASAPYSGSLFARNKSREDEGVQFEVPSKFADVATSRMTEIVEATTFENPNLHNVGHLYSKMQFADPVEMIVLLRKDPSLLKLKTADGFSVTLMAFGTSQPAVIQYVLDHGGQPKDVAGDGSTIMHLAAINGRPEVMDLAFRLGGSVSVRNKAGETPLIKSILTGQAASWKWLLGHGAKVDDDGGKPGASPARYAIEEGQGGALDALVQAGASPKGLDRNGFGWMHYGVANFSMLDAIAQYGVPVDQKGKDGVTPLMLAAQGGVVETEAWFLRHGAKASLTDQRFRSAFDYAKLAGNRLFVPLAEHFGQ